MENKEETTLTPAQPEKLPTPTFAPFFLAMGIALIFWGLISSLILSAAGGLTFVWGLFIWIKNLFDENDGENELIS